MRMKTSKWKRTKIFKRTFLKVNLVRQLIKMTFNHHQEHGATCKDLPNKKVRPKMLIKSSLILIKCQLIKRMMIHFQKEIISKIKILKKFLSILLKWTLIKIMIHRIMSICLTTMMKRMKRMIYKLIRWKTILILNKMNKKKMMKIFQLYQMIIYQTYLIIIEILLFSKKKAVLKKNITKNIHHKEKVLKMIYSMLINIWEIVNKYMGNFLMKKKRMKS